MTEKNKFINYCLFYFGGEMLCKRLIEINLHFCHLLCLGLFYKILKTEQNSENYKFWSIEKDISRSYHYLLVFTSVHNIIFVILKQWKLYN